MSQAYSDLVKLGMLGCGRQPLALPALPEPALFLTAQLDAADRERAFLSAAAILSQYERAGARPLKDDQPPPQPCPAEDCPWCGARSVSIFRSLFADQRQDLLAEWLTALARARQAASPDVLPDLLDLGGAHRDLREAILAVLGQRGSWLAAQNADWRWAASSAKPRDASEVWQTGDPGDRLGALRRLRQADPAKARDLLADTWSKETPEDRAAFLEVLGTRLTIDDEPFLEAALDDRRKEVRHAAIQLLARLPESALVRRMSDRVRPLWRFARPEPGKSLKLKKRKSATIEIELPQACDKAMQRDGIEPKPPQGLGEKAWWLMQMARAVPLVTWEQEWKAAPEEILEASSAGEWKKELLLLWTAAALAQRNPVWAQWLLDARTETLFKGDAAVSARDLIQVLPAERREAWMAGLIEKHGRKGGEDTLALLLEACPPPWSPGFSRTVAGWVRWMAGRPGTPKTWTLRNSLRNFARCVDRGLADEIANGWPTASADWEYWAKPVDGFISVVQLRRDIWAAVGEATERPGRNQ